MRKRGRHGKIGNNFQLIYIGYILPNKTSPELSPYKGDRKAESPRTPWAQPALHP